MRSPRPRPLSAFAWRAYRALSRNKAEKGNARTWRALLYDGKEEKELVSAIFETIGEVITGVLANLTNALSGITELFWVAGEGSTPGHLTILGLLSVFAVGAGIVYFVFNLIRSLIQRGAGRAA